MEMSFSLHSYTEMDVYGCVTCHVFSHIDDMCDVSYIFPDIILKGLGDFIIFKGLGDF